MPLAERQKIRMKYIKYRNMIIKYNGKNDTIKKMEGKSVLGKGKIEVLDNWCGMIDFSIEFVEAEINEVRYGEDKIVLLGKEEELLSSTILQSIIFLLYQKRNLRENIVSLHASAVVKGDEVIIFSGGKGSGKTSMAYLLAMKHDDIKLVANDYIELKINDDNTATVVYSDYGSQITFRSHVLYNLDRNLYRKLTNTNECIFNKYVKGTADFVDLSKNTLRCNKVKIYFVGMGKTKELEVSNKVDSALQIEVYKELVQYIRGKSVVAIHEDRKTISNLFIDSSFFFKKKDSEYLFKLLEQICTGKNFNIEWIRGQGNDIEKYVLGS